MGRRRGGTVLAVASCPAVIAFPPIDRQYKSHQEERS